jgi:hypothetical protein
VSRGGAAYRPETPRHTPRNWPMKTGFAGRYREDAASAAAGGQQAHRSRLARTAPDRHFAAQLARVSARGWMSGDRAAARRPPDLLSITRGALNGHHRLRRALTVPSGATKNQPERGFVRKLQEVTELKNSR